MLNVEYRLLLVESPSRDGDRAVVGLVHWDRATLRSQFNPNRVPLSLRGAKRTVTAVIRAVEQRIRLIQRSATVQLNFGLAALLPVQEGTGSAVRWTEIREASPTDASIHFTTICARYCLRPEDVDATRFSSERLRSELHALGARLKKRCGDQVVVDARTSGELAVTAPLAWRNGHWHYALPVCLDYERSEDVTRRIAEVWGAVTVGIAQRDVVMLVLVQPTRESCREAAEKGLELLRKARPEGLEISEISVISGPLEEDETEIDPLGMLEQRIFSEVSPHAVVH